jgi:hypothetical protein
MQTNVFVSCKSGSSLRKDIINDPKLEDYNIVLQKCKTHGRPNGWTNLRSSEHYGGIRVDWDANTSTLTSRIVTKGNGKPGGILGDYINYLTKRHKRRLKSIIVYF